jgi:hypothetical protein
VAARGMHRPPCPPLKHRVYCGDTSTRRSIGSCQPDALPVAQRAKPIGVCSH